MFPGIKVVAYQRKEMAMRCVEEMLVVCVTDEERYLMDTCKERFSGFMLLNETDRITCRFVLPD